MKRLGRWAFNILAGMSLTLAVAAAALWIRSFDVIDHYDRSAVSPDGRCVRDVDLLSVRGRLILAGAVLTVAPGAGWAPGEFEGPRREWRTHPADAELPWLDDGSGAVAGFSHSQGEHP